MLKTRYNRKRFFLFALIGLLVVGLAVTSYFIFSTVTFDERTVAISDIGADLNPSSGVITEEGLDIDIVINTHGEDISGVDITLEYSDTLDYTGIQDGEIENCVVEDVRQPDNQVVLYCFIPPDQATYETSESVFATANFRAVDGEQPGKIEVTEVVFSVRDRRNEIEALGGGGNYDTDSDVAITLNPSSGTITEEGKEIDLILDTHEEEVTGIDATLKYTGDIEYADFSEGEIDNCEVTQTEPVSLADEDEGWNSMSLYCFIDATQPTYKGSDDIFATVKFASTADTDDEAEIVVTSVEFAVRDDRSDVVFVGGRGEYEVEFSESKDPGGGEEEEEEEEEEEIPSCGSFDGRNFVHDTQYWPSGTFCSAGSSDPASPSFPSAGSATTWDCVGKSTSVSCSAQREEAPPPFGECGSLHGRTFTYESTDWPSGTFCSVGSQDPSSPNFPSPGATTSWSCVAEGGSDSCSASRYQSPTKEEELPETFIFTNTGFLIGFVLVSMSIGLFFYKGSSGKENFSMRNKLSF